MLRLLVLVAVISLMNTLTQANHSETYTCDEDIDCDSIEFSVCVDGNCRCPPNYLLTNKTLCRLFHCKLDVDCQAWDKNRVCSKHASRGCICAHNMYEDSINRICRNNTSIAWMLVVLLLPLLIVIIFCIRCFRLARTDINSISKPIAPTTNKIKHRFADQKESRTITIAQIKLKF